MVKNQVVQIKPPNFSTATFEIQGTAPLVIHRFSAKTKLQMKDKMEMGKAASSKKNREEWRSYKMAKITKREFNEALFAFMAWSFFLFLVFPVFLYAIFSLVELSDWGLLAIPVMFAVLCMVGWMLYRRFFASPV